MNLDLFEDNKKKYLLLVNVAFLLPSITHFLIFIFFFKANVLSLPFPIHLTSCERCKHPVICTVMNVILTL
jgi:hypothetical protein